VTLAEKALRPRTAALLLAAASLATIAGAWTYEWLGYLPCELCHKERIPYYAAIGLAPALAFAAGQRPQAAKWGLVLLALLFAAGALLSVYHSGVELKIFEGPSDCSGAVSQPGNIGDFLEALNKVKVVRCDQPSLWVLGLTLANWNIAISAGLAALAGLAARRA